VVVLCVLSVQPLFDNDSLKKQRRDIEKKMTVHVQQVSATQDQVGAWLLVMDALYGDEL
jgi:hypothetical protein